MSIIQRLKHEGVEGIRVGRFTFMVNTSVFFYRLGNTVIDCGPPNQWRFVKEFLQKRPVHRVLVTHHHEDHSGNGAVIQNELKIPVFAPSMSLNYLAEGYPLELYRRVIWGNPSNYRAETLPPVLELEDNISLHVLSAPGHSPDTNCFWIPERGWLFSGDLYIALHPQYSREDEDYPQLIESLHQVLSYDFDTVFCSHRGIVKNGRQALQKKLDYLVSLQERIQEMRREGKSLKEIKQTLLGREGAMTWITLFHFSKRNLILSLLTDKEVETLK